MYDVYFEGAKGCAQALVEVCSGSIDSGARILDVGTGTGNVAFEAARRFAGSSVIGVDIEEEALELARHKAVVHSLRNVKFQWADAFDLPFENHTFDVVLANQVVGTPARQQKMLSEILRVVRPGGVVGVAKSNPDPNKVMHWINDVAIEIATRRGMGPPRLEENPWKNTLPLRELLGRAGAQEIQTKRITSAHIDLSTFLINIMTMGRNFLDLVDYVAQCEPDDNGAQIRGCWEFLQIGRELIEKKYGGRLDVASEVASGKKIERQRT